MEFFLKRLLFRVFLSFSKLSRQPYRISIKQVHFWILHWKMHRNHIGEYDSSFTLNLCSHGLLFSLFFKFSMGKFSRLFFLRHGTSSLFLQWFPYDTLFVVVHQQRPCVQRSDHGSWRTSTSR